MGAPPRVALFADSFHEVNGLALTARSLEAFARRRALPLLSVRGGSRTAWAAEGDGGRLDLRRSRFSVPLDVGLAFDPLWLRHAGRARRALQRFKPDVVHVTGINDMGQLGAWLARQFGVPVVGSWHTNVHQFAARRALMLLQRLPEPIRLAVARGVERAVWAGLVQFYRIPRAVLAPSEALVQTLQAATGRPAFLMRRGIDLDLFSPARRLPSDGTFRLGYVGRLAAEKNVRVLAAVEQQLLRAGVTGFEFLIVGDGRERRWLEQTLRKAVFTGVLRDEALAQAYARMDLFVFPSETDTFGNAVLEALASGVPALVTDKGGPQSVIRPGVDGLVASDVNGLTGAVLRLMSDRSTHARMCAAARERAHEYSWEAVFEGVYEIYGSVVRDHARPGWRMDVAPS